MNDPWHTGWRCCVPELAAREWDLLIIGGGITGAGILLEAARRGKAYDGCAHRVGRPSLHARGQSQDFTLIQATNRLHMRHLAGRQRVPRMVYSSSL